MAVAAPALALGRPEPANAPGVSLTRWHLDCAVGAASFTADGRQAAFGLADGTVRLVALDRFSARRMTASVVHDEPICDVVPDPATGGVFTLARDGRAAAMDAHGYIAEIHEPAKDGDGARAIAAGLSGLRAIVTTDEAILYDRVGRKAAAHRHSGGTSISFDPAGRRLAIARDGEVALYCLSERSGPGRDIRFPCAAAPKRIAWAPDGARLAAAPESPAVPCWYLDGEQAKQPISYFGRAFTVAWSHDGRHLVGAGYGSLLCWNADRAFGRRTWFVPRALAPMSGCRVTALACHPAHALAAAGYDDGCIMLADLDTGRDKVVRHATGAAVTALAWSDCGGRLAAAGDDCEASLMDFSRLTRSH